MHIIFNDLILLLIQPQGSLDSAKFAPSTHFHMFSYGKLLMRFAEVIWEFAYLPYRGFPARK